MGRVITGIENIEVWSKELEGKRVGLITNPTGVNYRLESTVDLLKKNVNLLSLFSPEHGIRGNIQAGETVEHYMDEKTGLLVHSLYGKKKEPSDDMLEKLDILAMDIQDVGSRLYTYLYTMSYCMKGCARNNKTFMIFDRPNPLGGIKVEGNLIKEGFTSFVGLHPIPYRYGLTIGELAGFFNREFQIGCNLKIVRMKGWRRNMYYEETGLPWVLPSPNMPTVDTAVVYNSTCMLEGTNISEGRGTAKPFEFAGAPWLDAELLADRMNAVGLEGVLFRPVYFTPSFSKHAGILCKGVQLHVTDREHFNAVRTGLHLLKKLKELSGKNFAYNPPYTPTGRPMIDYNTGSDTVRTGDFRAEEVYQEWLKDADKFNESKKQYHLY